MMNKIYKVIWNAALQCWVAVSELGKAKGKTKSKKVLSAAAVMAVSAVGVSTNVEAAVNYATGTTYGNGMAIGSSSYANTNAAAYGHGANARALEDVAIGYKTISGAPVSGSTSHSSTQASVAVGTYANATHVATTAIGAHANAINNFATAVGAGALANKENGSAFGQGAMATGVYATALGKGALAKQDYSVALGKEAAANTQLTTSIGSKTNATGFSAIAIGSGHVPATGTVVIEDIQGAQATADDSMAVGASALANKEGATALGKLSKATNNNAVAVGPDSVASGSWATATGASANASGQASAAFGESATASGKKSIATGSHASASGENAIASGKNAKALANDTIAIGADANATANAAGSLAIGRGSVVNATDATVVGPAAQANGANATAVGRGAAANGTESAALGRGATATGNQSVALGQGAQATVDSGVALGNGAVANRAARDRNTIVINTADPSKTAGLSDNNNGGDANTVYAPVRLVDAPGALEAIKNTINGNKGAVSVGDSGNTRQIINVAAGSADSDAVNVAQLKAVAGGIKRYSVTSPDGSITVTNPTPGSDPQNFQIKMNTTAVQDAAQWYVKEGTETSGTAVRGGNTVSFNDSSTVDVQHNNKNFTFNVKSGDVTANTNTGAITAPTDGNVLAKAKNVAEAIQRSGWELQANGTKVGLVNPGDKVNIKAGTGVTITPTNEANGISTLTISAAQQNYSWKLKEDSQTAAQALNVTNNTAVSLKGENYLNITNRNGGNFAFKTVTADVGMNTATGATNQATATGLTTNKAVADAIAKSGFQLKENGTLKNVVNPGESLNFKPGQGTTVSVGTNGDVQVNANVADIRAGNNVTVTKGNNGVVTINAKDTNTQASVANGTGLTLTESNNSNGTKKYTLGVNVDNNTIKVENGKLVANLSGVTDTNTQSTVEAKANNFVTVDGSTKNTNGTTKYQVGVTTGDVAVTEATGAVTAISAATGVATNKTVADAIAKSGFQLQENGTLRNVVNPGEILNFKPGKGTTVSVGTNGDVQVNANVAGITAGKNISTTTDANGNVTINAKDTSAHVKAANNAAVKVDKADTTRTENNADITDYTVDLTDQTKTNITHGVNANETVTNKGLTFNGNTGSTGIKKLGSEVDVKGNTSNNVITTTANTNGITVDYNGTAAAQVTSLTYKANNANAKSVTLAKGLDFTNGTQTTAEVGDNGVVKFNVNTTTLSNATGNGNIQVPTGANSDGLVTAKNVANAINTSGWNLQANNVSVGLINPSDKVSFDAGNGVTVTSTNEANGVSHIKVAAKVDGSTITVNDQGQLVANLSGAVNTQASVSNATSSPVTVAVSDNTNGTKQYAVDVNVDGKTITKEGGVLKAVIPTVETVTLTVNTTGNNAGKVEAPTTEADKKKLVTAENVAKAINESYWVAKRGDSVTTNADSGDGDSNVAAGNNVTFVAGKNMALQKAGNKFIYATKDDVTFNNVTANNTTTTNLTVNKGGKVDMGGNKVENVANGTISNNSKDAVNGSQLYAVDNKFNNTVTLGGENNSATEAQKLNKDGGLKFNIVGAENGNITTTASGTDVKIDLTEGTKKDIKQGVDANTTVTNKGLTFNANTGNTGAKKLGSEVDVKGDTANNVITTNATEAGITINYNGTEAAKVTHLTYKANGANEQNVSLATGLNFKNGNGTTVTVGANGEVTYNANVSGLIAGDNVQIKNDGKGNFTIAATDTNTQSSVVNATSSPVTVAVSDNTNGTKQYAVDVNVDGKTITKEGGVLKAVIPTVETVTLTVNTTGNNAGKVEAPTTEADKKKLVTAENVAKAINESYWVAKRGDSVTTNADSGDGDSNVAAGNNVTFVAGKNMALQKAGNKFIYATKDDVTFNNVTANNTTTTNLTVKNGGNVDMGGNQVHNVSTGTAPTDAVNVKQLYDTVSGNVSTESVIKKAGEDNIAEVTVADNKQSGDKNAKYEVSVSKAKIKALANETVKVNTSTAANNPITVTPHTENGNTTYTVNFDGAKAAAEIPLTYKANDGTGKTVKLSEGLNFKNGTQTTAEVGDNGVVKFNVNTTTLSNTTANGKITVPDGNGLVTAKEVANAINAASWNLNVSGATVQNVKAGDFVSFANGNGTTVTYKDGAVRVNANVTDVVSANGNATITRDPNTGIVTVNAKDTNTQASVKNGSGITVTPSTNANGTANYTVAVNVDGSTITVNNDGKLVANVPDTSKVSLTNNAGKVGDVSAEDANKLVTGDNLAKTINATYWKASQGTHEETTSEETTGAVSSEIKPGDELTFVSGKNMALKKDGNKFVYATKDDVTFNNVTTNNLTVNAKGNVDMGGNQVHNVANGTKGTDAVNLDQLNATTATANAGWVIKANGTNATTVKPNATVSLNNTDGNILITKNTANNNVTFNFNPNATFGVVGKDGKDGVDGSIGVNGKDGASVVINGKDGSIGLTGPKGADGKDGVSLTLKPEKGTTTVNEKDANKEIERIKYTANGTTREVATLDDGLKFAGDDNAVINRTLGSLLNITGGAEKATVADNIRVTNDGKNGLKVQLSNNVTFNANGSVKVGDTTVNNGGLTITGGPSITKDGGVNAGDKVISNVSTGVKDNDAVNVKQLKDTVADSVSTESVIKKAGEDNIAEVTVADNKQSGDKNAKYEVSVSKAKIKALANETVKVNTSTAANNPITVTPHTENGNTTYTVNFDGAKAAAEIPLTYKANDGTGKTVKLSEGLNFKNGTQTTAEVGDNGVVKFNVNTTALSNVTNNGKITVPEGNGLVTAKEVAEAINASYWKANAGGNVDGATVADNVTTGTEVFFAAGKNLKVKHSANNFTFSTADDVSFNNVTTNNLTVNAKGNVDMGGNQVHNVANGTKGTDAVNLDQLNATTATAKTEVKAGKNVSSVNESKDAKDGHTVYTIDAVDTSAHVKAAESNAAVKVEKAVTTRTDGNTTVTDYTVDLTDETKANITHGVNANTTVTTKGLTFNGNEGTTGIKKLGSEVDVKGGTANNVITTNATEAGITINYNGTEAAKVTNLTYKANGANAQSVNLTTGLDFTNGTQTTAEVAANGVVKFNVNTTALSNVTNNGKITVPEGNGLVTAKEVAEAINASYWKANAGGNVDGATVADNVTTGTEVFFAAGKNLKVKHSANNFTFSTADDVSFNNVTTNNLTVNAKGNVDMGGNQVHNVANGTKGTDAVNLDQLNATTATANAGWVIKANGTNATTVKPNATVSLNNTDGNILITKNTANNNVTFNFNPNATFGVVGKDGKDGVDGSIGVNGKDGASVVINGKDGSIGLTGPKGADGKDGVSVTLKPEKGTTTVNAKDDGKEIERIKYTANGTTREVATLDDGLKFKGDSKQVINRTLGSQMNITGGADETTLTDNNIGVVYDNATDGLKVKLAKDVNLTSNGSVTIGNTTLNNNGFMITNKADPSKTVSVTDKGLNNGGNTIINVAPGVNGTDAVNLDQLNATTATANAGWVIKANGTNATTVKPNATVSLNNTDGNILITKNTANNDVTFNLNPNTTFGVKGKDGVDGSIGVNGKDGSSVVINGKDGSIGLNGKDGKNGLSIKGDQGPAGVDGKDGETKTRIVYEYADPKDPNKTIRENVATLNDGLRFTGNNGVENAHRLNTLVTIVGEGVDKAASANFTSASGNINVKADGKGTLEVQLAKNLKNIETINNGNSTITLNKDGGTTISGGDVSVDGNKVTNVKDGDVSANSKDAVNGSQLYHVMTNATAGWNLSVNNGKDKGNVKPGAQVDLNNTDGNIIISKTANNVTFNFNPNATFGVKGKDGKDGIDGSIGVNGKDGASVVINGKDGSIGLTGPKGADGKDGASANMSVQKGTTTVNTDRDGGKDVTRIVYTDKDKDGKDIKREVATLDDGLKFKGDSEQVINRTLGSQMNITGGADSTKLTDNNIGVVYDEATNGLKVKLSKDVDLGKDGSITIGGTQVTNNGLTIKNGPSVTEKGVDAGNKKVTNVADGDINATSKDAVNGSQLYQAVNNINKNVNAAKTELEEGDNVTITSRVGNNGQTIYKVSSTDNSAHVQGGSDAVSVTKAETTRKDGSTTVTDYTVDLSSKTKDDIKKGVDAHDTVTNKGLTFNADKGTTGAKKLGSQVAVNGDNKNIETVADTNGVKVKLKDDINVNSVTANTFKAGDTIVNTKGVQVAAKDDRGNNTNVVINEKGINAGNTRIQNVAAGRADTDAVNVSQLKGAVTQIGNHINKMDKNLRAGIAGAMAAGGLYHATLPGKSMVAAGAGTYKGESAVAVGYSRLSDNGKVGIKFSVNTNTRGDSGAAASVGYQW